MEKMENIIVFLKKIINRFVFDRLVFGASPCVADIGLSSNTPIEKRERATRTDRRHKFG